MEHVSWPPIVIGAIFAVGGLLVIRFRATVARCIPDFSAESGMRTTTPASGGRVIAARVLGVVLIAAGALVALSAIVRL